jgi:hypothetical protein
VRTLLSNTRLNKINRTLYGRGVQVAFYSVTPIAGETAIATLTSGFTFVREPRAMKTVGGFGSGVTLLLAADAGISRSQLNVGGAVALTINGVTTRYAISELLPQQQVGAGYVLRLMPLQGATA